MFFSVSVWASPLKQRRKELGPKLEQQPPPWPEQVQVKEVIHGDG
jgi:hypothetical protein